MGSENQDLEIITAFQKRRRNRLLRIGAVLAALVLSYFVCLYTYAVVRITQARHQGVYPTAEAAAIATYSQGFGGAEVRSIDVINCGPNEPSGRPAFIWFCTALVTMDQAPSGYERSTFLNGSFFIQLQDGWVFMPEQAFPELVGHAMSFYHLEGVP